MQKNALKSQSNTPASISDQSIKKHINDSDINFPLLPETLQNVEYIIQYNFTLLHGTPKYRIYYRIINFHFKRLQHYFTTIS